MNLADRNPSVRAPPQLVHPPEQYAPFPKEWYNSTPSRLVRTYENIFVSSQPLTVYMGLFDALLKLHFVIIFLQL